MKKSQRREATNCNADISKLHIARTEQNVTVVENLGQNSHTILGQS